MGQFLLLLVAALTVAAIIFGITVLLSDTDPGMAPVEPDGRAVPLPANRPLGEGDLSRIRFDTALRGYRMAQVDQALRRAAYDIGYKDELIGVLKAEATALREGRTEDADALQRARETALAASAADPNATGQGAGSGPEPVPAAPRPAVRAADQPGEPTRPADEPGRSTDEPAPADQSTDAATDRPAQRAGEVAAEHR